MLESKMTLHRLWMKKAVSSTSNQDVSLKGSRQPQRKIHRIRYLSSLTNAAWSGQDTSDACAIESVSALSIQSAGRFLACGVYKDHHCGIIDRDKPSMRANNLLHLVIDSDQQSIKHRALIAASSYVRGRLPSADNDGGQKPILPRPIDTIQKIMEKEPHTSL